MEFNYRVAYATLWLSPERGFEIDCGCEMAVEPKEVTLKSGRTWQHALHSLHVHPLSTSPYRDTEFPDGRIGEFGLAILGKSERSLYRTWIHLPDDQFNVLYAQLAAKNPAVDVQLCFNGGDIPQTASSIYNDTDIIPGSTKIPVLTYRMFVPLIPYEKPPC